MIKWHWGFDDSAKAEGTEAEIMSKFREVRDAIRNRIRQLMSEDHDAEKTI